MKIAITAIIAVVLTLAAMFTIGWAYRGVTLAGTPEELSVRVEPATRGPLVEVVSVPGEIQPEQKVEISSRVPAQILSIPHKERETVTGFVPGPAAATTRPVEPPESSVVVRLDARDLKAQLDSADARSKGQAAEIEVARARVDAQRATIAGSAATLADAERELGRQESLLATRDVSAQAVDQARTKADELSNTLQAARFNLTADEQNLIVLKHNLDAARADIDKAREQLSYTVITSSISGTIIRVNSKVGETVVPGIQGSVGSVILEVADLSRMLMIARVDEGNVTQLKVGQHAKVRMQAYRDRIFEGQVISIGLTRAEETGNSNRALRSSSGDNNYYEVRILLANSTANGEALFCGLTADADVEIKSQEGIKIPSQAVLGRPIESIPEKLRNSPVIEQGKTVIPVVYRLIDGKAAATPVKVGPSDETHTLVIEGLGLNDPIIVGPYKVLEGLTDGAKLKVLSNPTTQPTTKPTSKPAGQ